MNNVSRALFLAIWLFLPAFVLSDNEVIGTINAVVDGEETTWYVLKTDTVDAAGGASAMWMATGTEQFRAMIGGFENKDLVFSKDAATGMPSITGEGGQISIWFQFPVNAERMDYQKPSTGGEDADVILLDRLGDITSMRPLDQGSVTVELIEVSDTQAGRFEGSFQGRLINRDGEPAGTISEGRFVVDGAVQFQSP